MDAVKLSFLPSPPRSLFKKGVCTSFVGQQNSSAPAAPYAIARLIHPIL